MGQKIEGGIEKHQDLKRFTASPSDISAKDQIDLMARCWFSLTPNRIEPIEHEFVNLKTKRTESVRITGGSEHGIATIHDQDLIIFAISHWVEAKRLGLEPTRRICFTPYQFFTWMNKPANGPSYTRLRDALQRLKTTNIETTIRSANGSKGRMKQFSWISEWEIVEEEGKVRGVEVVLAEWLFESIQEFHVLTVDKRYFEIPGSVERWLYLYSKKATGGPHGIWKESFKNLHKKSASQQAFKHYAHTLRKIVVKNELPGMNLSRKSSLAGEEMLVMERTEKKEAVFGKREEQLALIEQSPLEEAWENAFEILCKHLGTPTANSWLKPLQLVGFESGTLTFRAPTKFIGDTVESQYGHKMKSAWASIGYEVATLRVESKQAPAAVRRGFTLVELSIVLIVIGLLIGGILAAQSMIDTARAQRIIRELQQYQIMVDNFGTKYNSFPGDSTLFTLAGNGDGLIWGGVESPSNKRYESANFWVHLKLAGMLQNCICDGGAPGNSGTSLATTTTPPSAYTNGARWGAFYNANNDNFASASKSLNYFMITSGQAYDFQAPGIPIISPVNAAAIDSKIDDGYPITGQVLSSNGYGSHDSPFNPYCIGTANSNNSYNLAYKKDLNGCNMAFPIQTNW